MQKKFIITFIAGSFLTSCLLVACPDAQPCGSFYSRLMHFGFLKGTSQKYVEHKYDIIILLYYQSCEVFTDNISGFYKHIPWRSLLLPVESDQKRVTARRQVFYSKLKMPLPASGTRFLDWKHNVRFEDRTQEAGGCRSITPLVRTLCWPRRIGWCKRLWTKLYYKGKQSMRVWIRCRWLKVECSAGLLWTQ